MLIASCMAAIMATASLRSRSSMHILGTWHRRIEWLTKGLSETSSISTFALPLTNACTALQSWTYIMPSPGPVPDRQEAPHPHQVILDPTGTFLLSPDLGADVVRVFAIDGGTGKLTPCANLTATPGSGPRHVSFYIPSDKIADPVEGTIMYLASELANTITSYAVAYPGEGGLAFTKMQGPVLPYPGGVAPGNVKSYVAEVRVHVRYDLFTPLQLTNLRSEQHPHRLQPRRPVFWRQ